MRDFLEWFMIWTLWWAEGIGDRGASELVWAHSRLEFLIWHLVTCHVRNLFGRVMAPFRKQGALVSRGYGRGSIQRNSEGYVRLEHSKSAESNSHERYYSSSLSCARRWAGNDNSCCGALRKCFQNNLHSLLWMPRGSFSISDIK